MRGALFRDRRGVHGYVTAICVSHRSQVEQLRRTGAAADNELRVVRRDEVEQPVGELLDAPVKQPGSILAWHRYISLHINTVTYH